MGNGHWISAYMPLQENLGGEARKGVLTRAELGSVAVLGVEVDKWLKEEEHEHEEQGGGGNRQLEAKGNNSHQRQWSTGTRCVREGEGI
jgi:hypothetical protein